MIKEDVFKSLNFSALSKLNISELSLIILFGILFSSILIFCAKCRKNRKSAIRFAVQKQSTVVDYQHGSNFETGFKQSQGEKLDFRGSDSSVGDRVDEADGEIHNMPIKELICPFEEEINENKIVDLLQIIKEAKNEVDIPPVDVLWVTGEKGGNYFYSFSGAHRIEAYRRVGSTVPAKLIKTSLDELKTHLGSATPRLM